ncbi:MAG: sulfatase [Candidatus Nanohaloarchaea archaeon]
MRSAITALVILAVFAGSIAALKHSAPASKDVPVVIITTDTVRNDHIKCASDNLENICGLSSDSVRFQKTYSPATWTLPSISSLMTGRGRYEVNFTKTGSGYTFGQLSPYDGLSKRSLTLAEILKKNGYNTSAYYEMSTVDQSTGLSQGFQHYTSRNETGDLQRYLRNHSLDGKNLYWFHLKGSHFPYRSSQQCSNFTDYMFNTPPVDHFSVENASQDVIDEFRQCYREEVWRHDKRVGRILDWVKGSGNYDDAVIVYAAAEGESLASHRVWNSSRLRFGHNGLPYTQVTHVPLIMKLPGVKPGEVDSSFARFKDISPTLLQALDIKRPSRYTGVSLYRVIDGYELNNLTTTEGFMMKNFALIRPDKSNRSMLFDLEKDPAEKNDISEAYPEITRELGYLLEKRKGDASSADVKPVAPYAQVTR